MPPARPETVVVDASAVIALLIDPAATDLAATIGARPIKAPALLPFEVANVLRRMWSRGRLTAEAAQAALATLQELPIELWPWDVLGQAMWQLRGGLTAYDAAYVALAALTDAALLTADKAMAKAAAQHCQVQFIRQHPTDQTA